MNRASHRGLRGRLLPRGTRRGVLAALCLMLVPTTLASAGVLEDRLQATRSEGRGIKQEMTVVERRQQVIVTQISKLNTRIAKLDRPIGRLSNRIAGLEHRIAARQRRIGELKADYKAQRLEIILLNRELSAARQLLARRVVAAYKTGDTGIIEQLAGAGSLRDLFEREEALGQVVGLDQSIIDKISGTERAVRLKRARNHAMRSEIRADILRLENDRADIDQHRATLQAKRDQVAGLRTKRDDMLEALRGREQQLGKRLDDLEADAKILREVIATGQSTYGGHVGNVSPQGLMWPVSGPVVSPFGPRWGRMHEGIDIAIAAGNPIHAAASGVVTHAGWMGGYGNMVIVQHAGNLATGYAHQSQIAVSQGQLVTQGQLLGFVGCTGHCFGDHVHFEVYVGGAPVDPMQYL